MSNYRDYNKPQPCPYCGADCHADFVDVGVGMVQCGPYHCYTCGASEIGPEMEYEDLVDENGNYGGRGSLKNPQDFTEKEIQMGWYDPTNGKRISPYANTVGGELVDHITAKEMYNIGLLDEKVLPRTIVSTESPSEVEAE